MGSGSFSAGMRGSSGGGSGYGSGLFSSLGNNNASKATKQTESEKDSVKVRTKIAKRVDFEDQLSNPLLNHVYKSLFLLSGGAFLNKNLHQFFSSVQVTTGNGCLKKWVERIMEEAPAINTASKSLIRMCLENFIIRTLGNDLSAYFSADAETILQKLKPKVFSSTSGYFLGEVVKQLTKREMYGTDKSGESIVDVIAQKKADKIISSFEQRFMGKAHQVTGDKQVTHENLFDVIAHEKEWFKKEFIK